MDSADFGPLPEAYARLPFRLWSSSPVAKEAMQNSAGVRIHRQRRLRLLAPWDGKLCVTAKPEAEYQLDSAMPSPLFEPGSTTQRHTHDCVIERLRQGD